MPTQWVLNRRIHGFPPGAIDCGRPGKWGNRFRIGQVYQGRKLTRPDVIEVHRDWLLYSEEGVQLLAQLDELDGHPMVCWCAPEPCHCDTYAWLLYTEEGRALRKRILKEAGLDRTG